jgi:DNA invertase Pin-like site-specific DNA recombinase
MKVLVPGDTVVVTKLDRLARSSRDLHNILHELQQLCCGFVSLGEAWIDHLLHCLSNAKNDPQL